MYILNHCKPLTSASHQEIAEEAELTLSLQHKLTSIKIDPAKLHWRPISAQHNTVKYSMFSIVKVALVKGLPQFLYNGSLLLISSLILLEACSL